MRKVYGPGKPTYKSVSELKKAILHACKRFLSIASNSLRLNEEKAGKDHFQGGGR